MIYTYLLRSERWGTFYTGISKNPMIRVVEHNRGNLKTTRAGRPWRLVYVKSHANYTEARRHEKWLKKKGLEYKARLAQLAPPGKAG